MKNSHDGQDGHVIRKGQSTSRSDSNISQSSDSACEVHKEEIWRALSKSHPSVRSDYVGNPATNVLVFFKKPLKDYSGCKRLLPSSAKENTQYHDSSPVSDERKGEKQGGGNSATTTDLEWRLEHPDLTATSASFASATLKKQGVSEEKHRDLRGQFITTEEILDDLENHGVIESVELRGLVGASLITAINKLSDLPMLCNLTLSSNELKTLWQLEPVVALERIRALSIIRNPITRLPILRLYFTHRMPRLESFNGIAISDEDKNQACELFSPLDAAVTLLPVPFLYSLPRGKMFATNVDTSLSSSDTTDGIGPSLYVPDSRLGEAIKSEVMIGDRCQRSSSAASSTGKSLVATIPKRSYVCVTGSSVCNHWINNTTLMDPMTLIECPQTMGKMRLKSTTNRSMSPYAMPVHGSEGLRGRSILTGNNNVNFSANASSHGSTNVPLTSRMSRDGYTNKEQPLDIKVINDSNESVKESTDPRMGQLLEQQNIHREHLQDIRKADPESEKRFGHPLQVSGTESERHNRENEDGFDEVSSFETGRKNASPLGYENRGLPDEMEDCRSWKDDYVDIVRAHTKVISEKIKGFDQIWSSVIADLVWEAISEAESLGTLH